MRLVEYLWFKANLHVVSHWIRLYTKDKEDSPSKIQNEGPNDVASRNEDLCRHGVVRYRSSGAVGGSFFLFSSLLPH